MGVIRRSPRTDGLADKAVCEEVLSDHRPPLITALRLAREVLFLVYHFDEGDPPACRQVTERHLQLAVSNVAMYAYRQSCASKNSNPARSEIMDGFQTPRN